MKKNIKNITKKVHISTIKNKDTVYHNGQYRTVCEKDLKCSSFMGITLFGDCYKLGNAPVILVSEMIQNL